jgi:hypothetical protein
MQPTVDPIDPTVRKADEERVLQPVVSREWSLTGEIVEFRPSAHLRKEKRRCEDCHNRHC